jgi:hypothetical protein
MDNVLSSHGRVVQVSKARESSVFTRHECLFKKIADPLDGAPANQNIISLCKQSESYKEKKPNECASPINNVSA